MRLLTRAMTTAAVLGMFGATVALSGEVSFSAGPTVKKDGKVVRISFTVSAETSAEVAVLDSTGTVVRHLAAGLLGKRAPVPFKKNALAQELAWDGKDDFGRRLTGRGYKVRVGLNLSPEFDRMLGYEPKTLSAIRGLAVDERGDLFILNIGKHMHAGYGSAVCNVFDRGGKYLRTIMPYRASCFPDRVKAFGVLDLGAHGKYPFLHANHLKSLYPFDHEPNRQQTVVLPDGRLVLVMKMRHKGTALVAVDGSDGGVAAGGPWGPTLGGKGISSMAFLACSPDGKTIYVSGVATQPRWKPAIPKHAVYRVKWGEKQIVPFIGKPDKAGEGKDGLKAPRGLAVDAKGNIYVADRGNDRVAVFDPQGKFVGEVPVKMPWMLGLHRKSGAIYVQGGGDPPDKIFKFSGIKATKPDYVQQVPGMLTVLKGKKRYDAYPLFTVDAHAEAPVIYVGSAHVYDRFRLLRFAETAGKLADPVEIGKAKGFASFRDVHVDRRTEMLYVNLARRGTPLMKIDGRSGKIVAKFGSRLAVGKCVGLGQDGHIYSTDGYGKSTIRKFDLNGKPVNFKGRDSNKSDDMELPAKNSQHLLSRGIAARPDGTVYLLQETGKGTHQQYSVSEWGPDGKMRKKEHIARLTQGVLSMRIDPAGNIYVGSPVKPAGQPVPPEFAGKVNTTEKHPKKIDNHYPIMYGSILKFPPGGGAGVGPGVKGGEEGLLAYDVKVGVKGALWRYFGVGPIPAYKGGNYKHYALQGCSCEGMRFDVDGWGRVFSPDAARFRVVVLDTAGNLLCSFGSYGNQDSPGGKDAKRGPEIPMAFPLAVGVSDRAAYVSDILSRRLVRVKLTHTVSKQVDVALP